MSDIHIQCQLRKLNTNENRRLQLGVEIDHKSEIIELVEMHYGSGKAMQVADILKEGE